MTVLERRNAAGLGGAEARRSVVVIGAGLTGMGVAARLAARGIATTILESHRSLGGCAGYFRRSGFAFDVGATTLVDYGAAGVGGAFLKELGLGQEILEQIPAYLAWVDRDRIVLHTEGALWRRERARALGDTEAHRRFWRLIDGLADTFWNASRHGARLPIRSTREFVSAARSLPPARWPMLRYLRWTALDALRWACLEQDVRLKGFVAMVVQDTVHAELVDAPLINASLGLSIRESLWRPWGGMAGFWESVEGRAAALGLDIRRSMPALAVRREREDSTFVVETPGVRFVADAVVCTLPIWDTARLAPPDVVRALEPWCRRDADALGGAALLTMGVPDEEVTDQALTHHQFLPRPEGRLGDGNNSFLSISSAGDTRSAPAGWRAVMMTTHVDLGPWERAAARHERMKVALGRRMLGIARRAYPGLGERAAWLETASPRTYARFTRRHRGAVGGTRLTLRNANQRAVPHDIGVPGWWCGGDTTWPGLGTVACTMAGALIADDVQNHLNARKLI